MAFLLDIDGALEKRSIFNHDPLRAHIANQRARLAQFHASGSGNIAFNPAMDNQIARGNARLDFSVRADDQAMVAQINRAFNRTIQIEVFTAGEFAFDLY